MADVSIAIALEGGLARLAAPPRFAPGATIQGTIQVMPEVNGACRRLLTSLRWSTRGRGDRNQATLATLALYQGPLYARQPLVRPFRFALPWQPWSYAGHYVSIVWEIAVLADLGVLKKVGVAQPFVLAFG
jgi:hypothetical protein